MYTFFCNPVDLGSQRIAILDRQQVHHIKDTLRLKVNDEVAVCDNKGNRHSCIIEELLSDKIVLKVKARQPAKKTLERIKVTVACAIPKKSMMDDIVDKLTQLGVDRIIPLSTQRVVVRLNKHKEFLRLSRWRKIAHSASQQSGRESLPVIDEVKSIQEVLDAADDFDLKLIPHLAGKRKSLQEAVLKSHKNILVLIGPEGDFSDSEVSLAIKAGCVPVSLGDSVLRVDTACVAVASYIRLSFL